MSESFAAIPKPIRLDRTAELLGDAAVEPSTDVQAGQIGTWTLTYTVGSFGIDEGGTIKIARRFPSDWQRSQFDQPAELGYTTVRTTGPARLAAHFELKGHARPWSRCLVIDVYDGSLAPGDKVIVTFGDTSQGSPGIRAQTYQESRHEFRVLVDPTNAADPHPLPQSPTVRIVAGPPSTVIVGLPSQAIAGQSVNVRLRGQDTWGNPTDPWNDLTLHWEGTATATLAGTCLTLHTPGRGRVIATRHGRRFASNPITVLQQAPTLNRYWGDLHAQSDATVGVGTEQEYFTFARQSAWLDFTSHQGNDFQMTDEDWQRLNDVVRQHHEEGCFVVFPGYEWSANTPAGGDRNVFYLKEDEPIIRSSAWLIGNDQADDLSAAVPVDDLFTQLRTRVGVDNVLCGAHVGGRYADISVGFDQQIGPLIEIVSCWGVFEWLLWDALDRGHIVGVMCNSDGHKGRPGAEGPGAGKFGIQGGLTCVLAEQLTRQSIFSALKQRRCYGTTGARIHLDFTVNDQPMGSVITTDAPQVHVRADVAGCGPVERLQLLQGRQVIHQIVSPEFDQLETSNRIRLVWRGSRIRGRGRRVEWDGRVTLENARIQQADTYSFDSPGDGITSQTNQQVAFKSATTGDADGLDLLLDSARRGILKIESPVVNWQVDLAELADQPVEKQLGGIDMAISLERYPQHVRTLALQMDCFVTVPPTGTTPLMIRAIQCDGQTAWSSPVYIQRP